MATLLAALALPACATLNYTRLDGPLYTGGVGSVPLESQSLRLVTYNIKLSERVALAIEALRRPPLAEADILALQEMDAQGVEQIASALGMNYVYYPSSVYRGTQRDFGNAILSPWPIEASRKLVLPHRGLIANRLRTATVATVRVGGRALRVYATHLGPPPVTTAGRRRAQMDVILRDAEALPGPVVILGDFNSQGVARHAASRGYAWLTREAGPTLRRLGRSFDFDHILTRGLRADCCLSAGVVRDGPKASDHWPVWATLRPLPPTTP